MSFVERADWVRYLLTLEESGCGQTTTKKRKLDTNSEEIESLSQILLTQLTSIRANVDSLTEKAVGLEKQNRQLESLNKNLGSLNQAQGVRIWELEQQIKILQSKTPVVLKPDMLGGGCHSSQL
jgi:septal ring factor EnvC (AmiA/AmiB activator)